MEETGDETWNTKASKILATRRTIFRDTIHKADSSFATNACRHGEWKRYFGPHRPYLLGRMKGHPTLLLRPLSEEHSAEFETFWRLGSHCKGFSKDMVMELELTDEQRSALYACGVLY